MKLKKVEFSTLRPGQRFFSRPGSGHKFLEYIKLTEDDCWEFNCVELSEGRLGVIDDEVLIKEE